MHYAKAVNGTGGSLKNYETKQQTLEWNPVATLQSLHGFPFQEKENHYMVSLSDSTTSHF